MKYDNKVKVKSWFYEWMTWRIVKKVFKEDNIYVPNWANKHKRVWKKILFYEIMLETWDTMEVIGSNLELL